MMYFRGTDGMLHAACASTGGTTASGTNICPSTLVGTELWAFVPRVQLPLIRINKARIDGSVRVVDVFGSFPDPTTGATSTTKSFRTILTFQTGYAVGTSPAVYALDVTDPAKPILLWEYTTPGTLSTDGFDLGTGLAMHAGATIASGAILNLAVAQTNNGGLYGSDCSPNRCGGMLATALKIETGDRVWDYGFPYAVNGQFGPRNVTLDNYAGLSTGIPGGAVGVDLGGSGFTTDVVMGDLFGNLWRLDAATGKSAIGTTGNTPTGGFRGSFTAGNTLFGGSPMFSFSTNFHPIGALPAILDNGFKVAVFGSGGYADPVANVPVWTTAQQQLVGVKLAGTATLTEGATEGTALGTLTINRDINAIIAGGKVVAQVLVVGTEVFLTTDTSDTNSALFGSTGASTGSTVGFNVATSAFTTVVALQGGASSLANNGTALYAGSADRSQAVGLTASTTGTGVDYMKTPKASRLAWLDTRF
jgi:Tfp pilus tip-associated adhesin PilY1